MNVTDGPALPSGSFTTDPRFNQSLLMSTVTEIEGAFAKLTRTEQREIALWLEERLVTDESPEMLAALDVGIRSLAQNGRAKDVRPRGPVAQSA